MLVHHLTTVWYYLFTLCADTFGARIRPADPKDEFTIHWFSVFNTQGRLASSVVGSWVPRCKHPDARGRVHAWNEVHRNARTICQC
eukprot:1644259-Pleurochrysis_carterae.AAC.1